MLNQAEGELAIRQMIEAIGVQAGDTLLVHSAFRVLSQQGLRAEWLIEEILASLGSNGTLLMPAMSWRVVTQNSQLFDVQTTAGNVGALAETFRKNYAQFRSVHPTHSVAGCGPDIRKVLDGHHKLTTPCPMSSGFGQVLSRKGKILLLGVGLECCTSIHCAEEALFPEIYLDTIELAETYSCIDWSGQIHTVRVQRHRKLPRDFQKFESLLRAIGKLRSGRILSVNWICIEAESLLNLIMDILQHEPLATLASSHELDLKPH